MKSLTACLSLVVLCAAAALGDGIPVDRGTRKVTVPHTVLSLTASQAEEVEILNTLTLTDEQWKQLRAVGPLCPKRFTTILPVDYDDCTCGVSCYVIQLSRTEVAVPHYEINGEAPGQLYEDLMHGSRLGLRVDGRGQFYFEGVLIAFPRLIETLKKSNGKISNGNEVVQRPFYVQMPLGVHRNSAVTKSRLDTLYATAKAAGWYVHGE
jgi:hypothetical protein